MSPILLCRGLSIKNQAEKKRVTQKSGFSICKKVAGGKS